MPRHATSSTANPITTTGGKGSEFRITKEIPHAINIDDVAGANRFLDCWKS